MRYKWLTRDCMRIIPENFEDLICLSKIISEGDKVRAWTTRKVKIWNETTKIKVNLLIEVEKVLFSDFTHELRVTGKILEFSKNAERFISVGKYHTITIKENTCFELTKKKWSSFDLELLERARKRIPKVLVVSLDEDNCCIAKTDRYCLKIVKEISSNLHGKHNMEGRDEILRKYFSEIVRTIEEQEFERVIIAGPGFVKEDLKKYIDEKEVGWKNKVIVKDISIGGSVGLMEVLRRGYISIAARSYDIEKQIRLVEELMRRIARDENATYGINEVLKACEYGAVSSLIILESLYVKGKRQENKKVAKILELVENTKGKIVVIYDNSEAGKQLKAIGGVGAFLRFKIC